MSPGTGAGPVGTHHLLAQKASVTQDLPGAVMSLSERLLGPSGPASGPLLKAAPQTRAFGIWPP